MPGENQQWTQEKFYAKLDYMRKYPRPTRTSEPAFNFVNSTVFNTWAVDYARASPKHVVQCHFIPPPESGVKDVSRELVSLMLEAYGDPYARRRTDYLTKEYRLADYFRSPIVELLVVADTHHLVTPKQRKPLLKTFKYFISYFKATLHPLNVLFIGEADIVEELVGQDLWTAGRVFPLPLPFMSREQVANIEEELAAHGVSA